MPIGSSDDSPDDPADSQVRSAQLARFGPAGFFAGLLNMLVLEFLAWMFLPVWYVIPVIVLPILVIDALISFGLTRVPGLTAQIGRAMLITCIAAPLTLFLVITGFILGKAIGPL